MQLMNSVFSKHGINNTSETLFFFLLWWRLGYQLSPIWATCVVFLCVFVKQGRIQQLVWQELNEMLYL